MKRINLRTNCAVALGLGVMLAIAPHAFAQAAPPAPDAAPGAAGQTSAADVQPGNIDTSKSTTVTTTTTQPTDGTNQAVGGDDNTKPLPNTGGDPLLFVLAGGMLIAGGWVLRRKWTIANEQ